MFDHAVGIEEIIAPVAERQAAAISHKGADAMPGKQGSIPGNLVNVQTVDAPHEGRMRGPESRIAPHIERDFAAARFHPLKKESMPPSPESFHERGVEIENVHLPGPADGVSSKGRNKRGAEQRFINGRPARG
jgi:hypothetical protein